RKVLKSKAAKLPKAAKARSKLFDIESRNRSALRRAVSFCAKLTLGIDDAIVGRSRESRREICASTAQCRFHGSRHHRRGARLRPVAEEISEPHRRRPYRPPSGPPAEAPDLHERQR